MRYTEGIEREGMAKVTENVAFTLLTDLRRNAHNNSHEYGNYHQPPERAAHIG